MYSLDEEKIEFSLGSRGDLVFWQGKKAENVVFLFLAAGFAVFICL